MAGEDDASASLWRPAEATPRDEFALMLHDRVVALEAKLAALEPRRSDPHLRVLGAGDARAVVFVRARTSRHVAPAAVAAAALRTLGVRDPGTRWELWGCQHWTCLLPGQTFVLECVVQRFGGGDGADPVTVGHAVLDAVRRLAPEGDASAEAYAPRCPEWFAESVRAAGGGAAVHAWDPRQRAVVTYEDSDDEEDQPSRRAWVRLHGWLASQVEATDVWHPHALIAETAGADLVACLARGL